MVEFIPFFRLEYVDARLLLEFWANSSTSADQLGAPLVISCFDVTPHEVLVNARRKQKSHCCCPVRFVDVMTSSADAGHTL
jgi:hypothetical protein